MKNISTPSERHITLAIDTLKPSTRIPKVPADRQPKLHQSPRKSNNCVDTFNLQRDVDSDQDLEKLRLYKSFIIMIGSFLERAPNAHEVNRSAMREAIKNTEICLGLRDGKLNAAQFGKLLILLDTIAPFRDGELTQDLEALEAIVQGYGNNLASARQ